MVLGESMLPGFRTGDILLVDTRLYRKSAPKRGDIVVARHRHELIVKRVVGLPGEDVEIRHGRLHLQGQRVREPYAIEPGLLNVGRGRLFDGKFALCGDNRAIPAAQVVHAIVSQPQIAGKVVFSLRLPAALAYLRPSAKGLEEN
jgi:signal peptidase I